MEKFISFQCRGQYFTLYIGLIEKIILYEKPIVVPESSEYIMGYISYEEKPLPIIDLNTRFFGEETIIDESSRIIVVHWKGQHLGLLVDEVTTVQEYKNRKTQSEAEKADESYIIDTFYDGENIVLRVDIDKMFVGKAEAELQRLLK